MINTRMKEIMRKLENKELENGAIIAEEKCGCKLVLHKKHLNEWDNVRWFELKHVICGRSKHTLGGNKVLRFEVEYVTETKEGAIAREQ